MLEHLFGSKTRVKLLRIFFRQPEQRFFVRELTRLLGMQINAIRRELTHLTDAGIIEEAAETAEVVVGQEDPHEGKRKYYRLKTSAHLYPELKALLFKSQVRGEETFMSAVCTGQDVRYLLLTGVFQNVAAPIDMLIVGNVIERKLHKIVSDYEKEFGFPIRYTALTTREWIERKQLMDRFLYSVLESPHEVLVDRLSTV